MRSLISDPMSWWPLGFAIGGLIGVALRRHDQGVARQRRGRTDPTAASDHHVIVADTPDTDDDQFAP